MFELHTNFKQILKLFNPRTQPIQSTVPFLQDPYYLEFLGQCSDTEITPDIDLFGYETTIKENQYFVEHVENLSQQLWKIGRTGQGDEWFLDRNSFDILFYDHDLGMDLDENLKRDQFQSMQINFFQFLQFALLLQALEQHLDKNPLSKVELEQFQDTVNRIHPELFSRYPFDYL